MTKIKIAIVDDEQLFKEGMKSLLQEDKEFKIAFTAHNGKELIDILELNEQQTDIILLDLSMPKMDGIDALRKIMEINKELKIIILTSHYNDSLILKLLDEGASGFLAKNETSKEVINTIKKVFEKGFYVNDHILQLIRSKKLLTKRKESKQELTAREIEILIMLCDELSTKQISEKLGISSRTVESHRTNILEKTNSKNLAGLVIYAIEYGYKDVKFYKFK